MMGRYFYYFRFDFSGALTRFCYCLGRELTRYPCSNALSWGIGFGNKPKHSEICSLLVFYCFLVEHIVE